MDGPDPRTPGASGTVSAVSRLAGRLRLPADKSVAHRALLFSAMGAGSATVRLDRPGGDVLSMAGALHSLGALADLVTDPAGVTVATIRGGGTASAARLPGHGGETLDCGNAGTAMRLLAGALAGRPGTATLVGDASLSSRPMERVAGPLREVGATIETTDGHAPLRITGRRPLRAMAHRPAVASAQVIGCLSLAALAADGTTSITVPGPTRDHTERMLAWLGAPVRREGLVTTIDGPAGFAARSLAVPGDISSAAAWLVAGALHPTADIRLEGVGLNPSRVGIIDVLREMGADIEVVLDGAATATGDLATIPSRWAPSPCAAVGPCAPSPSAATGWPTSSTSCPSSAWPWPRRRAAASCATRRSSGSRNRTASRSWWPTCPPSEPGSRSARTAGWSAGVGPGRRTSARKATIASPWPSPSPRSAAWQVPYRIDDPACAAVSYPSFWTDLETLSR